MKTHRFCAALLNRTHAGYPEPTYDLLDNAYDIPSLYPRNVAWTFTLQIRGNLLTTRQTP